MITFRFTITVLLHKVDSIEQKATESTTDFNSRGDTSLCIQTFCVMTGSQKLHYCIYTFRVKDWTEQVSSLLYSNFSRQRLDNKSLIIVIKLFVSMTGRKYVIIIIFKLFAS